MESRLKSSRTKKHTKDHDISTPNEIHAITDIHKLLKTLADLGYYRNTFCKLVSIHASNFTGRNCDRILTRDDFLFPIVNFFHHCIATFHHELHAILTKIMCLFYPFLRFFWRYTCIAHILLRSCRVTFHSALEIEVYARQLIIY